MVATAVVDIVMIVASVMSAHVDDHVRAAMMVVGTVVNDYMLGVVHIVMTRSIDHLNSVLFVSLESGATTRSSLKHVGATAVAVLADTPRARLVTGATAVLPASIAVAASTRDDVTGRESWLLRRHRLLLHGLLVAWLHHLLLWIHLLLLGHVTTHLWLPHHHGLLRHHGRAHLHLLLRVNLLLAHHGSLHLHRLLHGHAHLRLLLHRHLHLLLRITLHGHLLLLHWHTLRHHARLLLRVAALRHAVTHLLLLLTVEWIHFQFINAN